MKHLILDASLAGTACLESSNSKNDESVVQKLSNSDAKLWLYTGQISEILSEIEDQLPNVESPQEKSRKAKTLLKDFSSQCNWLSMLSEDVLELNDEDMLAMGLVRAAERLSGDAMVVTEVESRLLRGRPFIQPDEVLAELMPIVSVPFVDLSAQQDQIRATLERNIHRVLHHGRYVMGPEIEVLETRLSEYVGVHHCVSVSSGTDALLIAMMALDIGRGDEVITTPFTFFAAVETIKLLGATPVYVDIDPESYTLDPEFLESKIGHRTRAILPVSLYGQCADMDRINEIAASYQIPVIEDAAQSFGATYKGRLSCSLTQIGCTSFFPAKPFGAYGDAGACFTQDQDLADRMRQIRDHGQSGRYCHSRIGINGRMDTLQAAVLLAKIEVFEQELISRAKAATYYSELMQAGKLGGLLKLPMIEPHNTSSWAQYTIEISDRSYVQRILSDKGIPTVIHYPKPVYAQPSLSDAVADCPVSEHVAKRVLSLPMHPYLKQDVQQYVTRMLIETLVS